MPSYRYYCEDCGCQADTFLKYKYDPETKETKLEEVLTCGQADVWLDENWEPLQGCGSTNIHKQLPRSFGIMGESTGTGCDARGYFSASLGRYVSSRMEERKIMDANGFIPVSDLGGDKWWDDTVAKQMEKVQAQEQKAQQYQTALQNGKTKEEAVAETFTAKEAIDGTLEKIYDRSISTSGT